MNEKKSSSRGRNWTAALTVATAMTCSAFLAQASDHIDFPKEVQTTGDVGDPVSDITDLFAFRSPRGNLVLAMDVNNGAGPLSRFSDKIDYVFRLHRATRTATEVSIEDKEFEIVCRFEDADVQKATCSTSGFETTVSIDDETGGRNTKADKGTPPAKDLKVFAGLRHDPFFLDVISTRATLIPAGPDRDAFRTSVGITDLTSDLVMPRVGAANSMSPFNVLSIVVEIDTDAVFGPGSSMFAVIGETYRVVQPAPQSPEAGE